MMKLKTSICDFGISTQQSVYAYAPSELHPIVQRLNSTLRFDVMAVVSIQDKTQAV